MSAFSSAEHGWMARALQLARRGLYTTQPNPRVGCVLVNAGEIVGEGWHRLAGEAHAEISALQAAGSRARGCSAYVTLEPCSHQGKTPPCVHALIDAGVAEVIVAIVDPNPKVAGAGLKSLEDAGIAVKTGLLETEALKLNAGFMSRFELGRPFVRLKIAASLDGRTAMASGESQWITGEAARRDVQRLRASSAAVMTGVATVIADDPQLTVRDSSIDSGGLQPLRVVLDSQLRMPASARMLAGPGNTVVFCINDQKRKALEAAGAEVRVVPEDSGKTDLMAVLQQLAMQEINDLLVEAGPGLAGSLLASGLVDELVIYQAPHIMGSETQGMLTTPTWQALKQRLQLDILDVRTIGQDIRITARPIS